MVEHWTENPGRTGSIPVGGTILTAVRYLLEIILQFLSRTDATNAKLISTLQVNRFEETQINEK